MERTVTLGEHEVPVVAQPWAKLVNRLGRFIPGLAESGNVSADGAGMARFFGENAYEALCILIPRLKKVMPEWEFRGYESQQAFDAGEDPESDSAPTFPQIGEAFEVAIDVNGQHFFEHIKKLVDPTLLRSLVNSKVAEAISGSLPTSPSTSGGQDSTSSSQSTTTKTSSGDGPSPDSGGLNALGTFDDSLSVTS
jgi:hypothetical protein